MKGKIYLEMDTDELDAYLAVKKKWSTRTAFARYCIEKEIRQYPVTDKDVEIAVTMRNAAETLRSIDAYRKRREGTLTKGCDQNRG